ncbi:MAG: GGDEF domain-containing protein [Herminiimonas sp.]|nr:GGDEF domain-containing protein [Herminiimonas sp.]
MLGLLALACVLPVALIAGAVIAHDYQRERNQLIENTVMTSRSMIRQVDQVFAGVETSLSVLETSPALFDPDRSRFHARATAMLNKQLGRNIRLTDVDGKQLVDTLSPYGAPPLPHADTVQITKLRMTHAAVISDLFPGTTDSPPIVAVAIPVIQDGEHLYNISSGLLPAVFSNLLAQQELPVERVAAIIDSSGTIVARTKDNDKFLGTKASPDLLSALRTRPEGFVNGKTLDGVAVVAGFSQSQVTGWTTVVAIPVDVLTRDLHRQLLLLVVGTGLVLLVGLSLARMIGGRIIRANRGLIAPAFALGEGKPIDVPKFGVREADEVGEALAKASERLLATQHKANHDNLTALPNRGLFYEVVARQMRTAARNKSTLSLLFIDLDGFKKINDQFGHAAGDEILRQVAARFGQLLRASDTSSRLGGDEFAVALSDTEVERAEIVAKKIVEGLSVPYMINSQLLHISASIGIAVYGGGDMSVETLVRAADDAMYVAKASGKARAHVSTVS